MVQVADEEANFEERQLRLLFCDYPDYPAVVRKLTEVAGSPSCDKLPAGRQ